VSPVISGRSSIRSYALLKPDLGFFVGLLSTRASSSSVPSFFDPTAAFQGLIGVHVHGACPTRAREFLSPWSAREGHAQFSRSWRLVFGGPWWLTAVGRSLEPACVTYAPSPVIQELPVLAGSILVFLPCFILLLYFLSFCKVCL
jgi:hypothetical protein